MYSLIIINLFIELLFNVKSLVTTPRPLVLNQTNHATTRQLKRVSCTLRFTQGKSINEKNFNQCHSGRRTPRGHGQWSAIIRSRYRNPF